MRETCMRANKGIKFLRLFFLILFLAACEAQSEEKDGETMHISLAEFGAGWNLGNTLDAKSDGSKENLGLSTETSWGMPETTQAMIQAVAAQGFKTIRIPVSWHNHIKSQKNKTYTIDSAWMKRVKTLVDWSLQAGLRVIINIHHDNLTESQMSSTYGFCVSQNPNLKIISKNYLNSVWSQVAKEFKNYDERLVFEVLNEPRCIGTAYEWYGQGKVISDANKIIVDYEKVCLDAIRAAGGNNETRFVMIPPYAANPDLTDGWTMPADSVDGRLIVSVHAYTPYEFCMNEDSNSSYTSNVQGAVEWLFKSLKEKFSSEYPVIVGEASASDKGNLADRLKWTEFYFSSAKAAGMPVIIWDNMVVYPNGEKGERHGYFNRSDLSWFYPELTDAMVK